MLLLLCLLLKRLVVPCRLLRQYLKVINNLNRDDDLVNHHSGGYKRRNIHASCHLLRKSQCDLSDLPYRTLTIVAASYGILAMYCLSFTIEHVARSCMHACMYVSYSYINGIRITSNWGTGNFCCCLLLEYNNTHAMMYDDVYMRYISVSQI